MITNSGKDIIAKFLIGQVPSYAAYMAFGSGAKPLASTTAFSDYSNKNALDFELFRVPITSRGYVTDVVNNQTISKIVFTSELPTEQRYGITEVGIYSAKVNPLASSNDSKMLFNFTESENWEFHNSTGAAGLGDVVYSKLDSIKDGRIDLIYPSPQYSSVGAPTAVDPTGQLYGTGATNLYPFRTVSSNLAFDYTARKTGLESGRMLDGLTIVPGNMSYITYINNLPAIKPTDSLGYYGSHIHLSGISLGLDKNSPSDEIKIAISIMNKDSSGSNIAPGSVTVMIEFASDDSAQSKNYARFYKTVGQSDINTNRYQVLTSKLSELSKSTGFTWSAVTTVKVYVSAMTSDTIPVLSNDYLIGLDAIRFDNITDISPVYGLVGYTVIKSQDIPAVIVKDSNTTNSVEFRFGLDING